MLDSVVRSLAPHEDATPAEVRKNGLVCLAIGFVSFAIGAGLLLTTPEIGLGPAPFIFVGYALIGAGGYRALMGRSADPEHPGDLSPLRVLIAAGAIVIAFVIFFGLVYLVK
jgi:hypothetical protein